MQTAITNDIIKNDYCRRLQQVERLTKENERLRREKRMLERYRENVRRDNLAALSTETIETREKHRYWRYGMLFGMVASSAIYTAMIYIATH